MAVSLSASMPRAAASAGILVRGGRDAPRFQAQMVTGWTPAAAAMSTPRLLLSASLSVMSAYLVNLYVEAIEKYLVCICLDFTDVFRNSLGRAHLTHAALASIVGVTPGFVSQVATKRSKIPPESIGRWADALHLQGDDREQFVRLAFLAHAPEEVRQLVNDLDRQLAHRFQQVGQLIAEFRRRGVKIPESCRDL